MTWVGANIGPGIEPENIDPDIDTIATFSQPSLREALSVHWRVTS